jgi:benzoate-CoA ligase family protein
MRRDEAKEGARPGFPPALTRRPENQKDAQDSPAQIDLPREYNASRHFIDRHVEQGRGKKIAYIDDRGAYTYAQLAERVNRAGNVLRKLGVEPEQRVILCLLDGIDLPALFWGAIKIGAVPVPISTMLKPADYDFMLRDSRARVLAVSGDLLDRFEPVLGAQPTLKAVLVSAAPSATASCAYRSFADPCAQVSGDLEPAETMVDDAALWLYTSGSTGKPKAAVHLHGDLVHTAVLYGEKVLELCESDVMFSAAKLFFAYGLGNCMTFPLHVGATAVLMAERPTAEAVMRRLRELRPTVFFGVPTLYANILANPALDRSMSSERLRLCVSAGEALPESVGKRWVERFGVDILDGIGSTEMLHIFISNRPGEIRYGTTGKPVPGYDVVLLDENGCEPKEGEIGDLWCRGPSASPGYWNNRAASLRTFAGPWVNTGDKYLRDADGYYHYVGRADEMLKAGGIWVSPHEVESVLMAHPDVLQAAVVGAPDAEGLIKPKAFVVLNNGAQGSPELAEQLTLFVKERLAHYKCPRWMEFRTELPMTSTAKLQRYKLRTT